VEVGHARGTTVMTVGDVERVGVEKIVETALELAWHRAKAVYLSFDIDVIDSGFVPGIGWPEPGGLLPREALALVRGCAEGGLSGMEIVECSPPYDWAEQTSLISARVVLDALASLVRVGKLGNKAATRRPDAWGPIRAMHRATRAKIIPPATTRCGGKADQRLTPCRCRGWSHLLKSTHAMGRESRDPVGSLPFRSLPESQRAHPRRNPETT
jgi:hypothetical protein